MSARIDLDALERLAEKATPGPWAAGGPLVVQLPEHVAQPGIAVCDKDADAKFIAACDPVTVAALVRAVKAAMVVSAADTMTTAPTALMAANLRAALAPFALETGEGVMP